MASSPPSGSVHRRSAARLAAVQALYQIEMTGAAPEAIIRDILERRIAGQALMEDGETEREISVPLVEPDSAIFSVLVRTVATRRHDIDGMIDAALSPGWTPERLETIVRCILRVGIGEVLERPDVPVRVVITEYVDVAHAFYAGPEPGLINAVLDRLGRRLRPHEFKGPGHGASG
ncbi:MAG: N utilization substance protein B [Rhodospirillaceae bacterium]|nr:MAG: N utilization substance protein B [Rhodospirillaceae bacterium]